MKHLLRSLPFLSLALAMFLSGCSTVPVTGRKQFNIVSDTEVVKMSIATFEQMKAQLPRSTDPRYNGMLERVGERISQQVFWDMPLAEWEFVVFDHRDINAFAMPGGKVGVYAGLFRIVHTEDELASVVAHEIAHVTARHTHEKLSQAGLLDAGGNVLGVATSVLGGGTVGSLAGSGLMSIYNVGATTSSITWDRAKESEADRIGIKYMAQAGYDPQASITVMERMVEMDGGVPDPWYSTHPSSTERLDALHSYLEDALVEYEKAKEIFF